MTNTEFKKRFLPLHKELYSMAMRMLGDSCEAEDAVQNLYMKLWERRYTLYDVKKRRSIQYTTTEKHLHRPMATNATAPTSEHRQQHRRHCRRAIQRR